MPRIAISCAAVMTIGSAFGQDAPLKLSASQQEAVLGAIRQYALTYTQGLPNFTCTQLIWRVTTPLGRKRQSDLVEEELSIVDGQEHRAITKINGQRVAGIEAKQLIGPSSRGEFGNLLANLFDPETEADFRWERFTTLNRQKMYVLSFRVPQATGYTLEEPNGATIRVAYRGWLYADYQTKAVMRLQMSLVDIPGGSEYKVVDLTLDYKPEVAYHDFVLPSHYRFFARMKGSDTTSDTDYKSYRRFGSEATVVFDDGTR